MHTCTSAIRAVQCTHSTTLPSSCFVQAPSPRDTVKPLLAATYPSTTSGIYDLPHLGAFPTFTLHRVLAFPTTPPPPNLACSLYNLISNAHIQKAISWQKSALNNLHSSIFNQQIPDYAMLSGWCGRLCL